MHREFSGRYDRRISWDPRSRCRVVCHRRLPRGYTGHTMLDNLGLVHMNGRVYDPAIGRFLSADPYVQFPLDTQSWNRYSYVVNNPLSFTDPSGYFLSGLKKFVKKYWKPIVAIVAAVVTYGAASGWIAASAGTSAATSVTALTGSAMTGAYAGAYATAAAASAWSTAAIAGAAAGAVAGGITGGWRGAAAGAVTGGLLGAIGAHYGNRWTAGRVVAEGAVGGIGSEIQGGTFADGFKLAAGFSALRWGAYEMRQAMVAQSCSGPGPNPNCAGVSAGANGDNIKLGGGRVPEGQASYAGVSPSPLGGNQGGPGYIGIGRFGFAYQPGSLWDRLIESYAGPHDWLSSFRYLPNGNIANWTGASRSIFGIWSAAAIVPATPFAIATAFPSTVILPATLARN
ncbi:MAG: RHS repeat-associated core domain-containing protein [Hyphomicrobiaceae bacterium]